MAESNARTLRRVYDPAEEDRCSRQHIPVTLFDVVRIFHGQTSFRVALRIVLFSFTVQNRLNGTFHSIRGSAEFLLLEAKTGRK